MNGDVYLNAISAEFAKHLIYPDLARPLGLSGTAEFVMKIDRTGTILGLQLQASSGTDLLDRAAEKMIRDTAKVAPPPADIPGDPIIITMEVNIGPR